MNKYDLNLILVLIIILLTLFLIFNKQSTSSTALVYYDNDLIKQIDLTKDNIYTVDGYNGLVKIEVKSNKIRVIEENSKRHLCSKQGYISNSYESIICLPNKIVISMSNNELDGVVK